jgi:hypothetical protein
MIKLIEIYEDQYWDSRAEYKSESVKARYKLREVFLNPEYITSMQSDLSYQRKLSSNLLVVEGDRKLNSMQRFTKINYISGNTAKEIVVVASVEELVQRVNSGKTLLKG